VGVVLLYAATLLLGPLVALVAGALGEGPGTLLRELRRPDAVHALKLTLLLALGATLFNALFGVCVALVIVRQDFRGRGVLNALVDLPFAVSPVIAGFAILLLFGREGWLQPVAEALDLKVVFALPGMLLATSFVPVLRQLGTDQETAAYTLGASPWQAFLRVTLPGLRWGLVYGISLTFARAVGEFGAVLVVSGGVSGLTETATLFIFRSLDDRNEVAAYGMAIVLALLSTGVLLGLDLLRRRAPGMGEEAH
jgi:sulfate transport system permease protein